MKERKQVKMGKGIINFKNRETRFDIGSLLFITIILFISLFGFLVNVDALIISGKESSYYNGTIDELRIWNRTLSADEIKQHYSSNLRRYDKDKWEFYTNQSNLSVGNYTYYGYAKDKAGKENITGVWYLTILGEIPFLQINFIPPTPINNTNTTNLSVEINISIIEGYDLDEVKFNWNGVNYSIFNDSVVLFMNFDNRSSLGENDSYVVDISKYGNNGATNKGINITQTNNPFNSSTCNTWVRLYHREIYPNSENVTNYTADNFNYSSENYTVDYKNGLIQINCPNGPGNDPGDMQENTNYYIDYRYNNTEPNYTAGKYGYGLEVDGWDDTIKSQFSSYNNYTELSWGGWFKRKEESGNNYFGFLSGTTGNPNIYRLSGFDHSTSSGNVRLLLYNGSYCYTNRYGLNDANWHHIFAVYKKDDYAKLYVDGVETTSDCDVTKFINFREVYPVSYVPYWGQQTNFLNGTIDNFMIFNRSLSAEEIQQLYFTNLYKYNSTQWYLYVNQSKNSTAGLDFGKYTYSASAKDRAGNENITEVREITIEEQTEVTGCRVLGQANTVYTQKKNIVQDENKDCIVIAAENITYDCKGYSITSFQNVSGIYSNQLNTTIKNCNVTMGNNGGKGIKLVSANNSYIYNSTLNGQTYGLELSSTYYTKIEKVTVLNSVSGGKAVSLSSSSNNILTDMVVANNNFYGFELSSSNNNILKNINASSNGYAAGFYISSSLNNTFVNITANDNPSGFYFLSSSNNVLTNITANSNSGSGIEFMNMYNDNNTLTNVIANSNAVSGISLSYGRNNILTNITANSNSQYGIYLASSSDNNLTNNNIWNCTSSTYGCLYLSSSNNNTISGGIINKSSNNSIYLEDSDNNLFRDILLINAAKNDTFLNSTSINNTFLNVSYNISKEYVSSDSQLIRKWYYQAYVNDTSKNNVANANVSLYDKNNQLINRVITDSTGWINRTEIIDYVNYGGVRDYYSPYTITAVNKTSVGFHRSYNATNVTNNLNDVITIDVEYSRIKFISPEPDYITDNYWAYVNVSANDTYSNISTFIDFDKSLAGWWRMDDVSGNTVYDNSSYGNDGTAYGNANQIDAGYLGKAFSFDGNGDYVQVPDSDYLSFGDGTNDFPFSISAWVRLNASNQNYAVVDKYQTSNLEYVFGFTSLNRLSGWVYDNSASAYRGRYVSSVSSYVLAKKWYHVAMVYYGNKSYNGVQLYINGVKRDNTKYSSGTYTAMENKAQPVSIGRSNSGIAGYFNGSIDDVMIFNRSLSAEEISALYANQSSRYLTHNFTGLSNGTHTFKAYAQDTAGNVNSTERSINIQNLPPSIPELLKPENNDNTLRDRYVYFNWTDSVDNRNEPITYEINLSNNVYLPSYVYKTGIIDSNYTWQEPLELDTSYNWSVRACDNYDLCSNWSVSWNFSIMPYISINLIQNETKFGTVTHKEIKNTTIAGETCEAEEACPFIVENIGNIETDIKVNASKSLWERAEAGLDTNYFQFMAGNTTEKNSFNWEGSQIIWENMAAIPKLVIDNLGYNLTNNSAEIEFRIEVHQDEPTEDKSTNITVIAS